MWWSYLDENLKELLLEASLLSEKVGRWEQKFHDYAFVVFPAAKAYEGFLKKLFWDLGFINQEDYQGKRFRVGKALNPELDREKYRHLSIYDKLVAFCQGEDLARKLWKTWIKCRNLTFHWFPGEKNKIDLQESRECLALILDAIDSAYLSCKIDKS